MSARFRLHAAPATVVSLPVILGLVSVTLVVFSGAEAAGQGQPQCGATAPTYTALRNRPGAARSSRDRL
jgi:hypothetical protein